MLTFAKIGLFGMVLLSTRMAEAGDTYIKVKEGSSCERISNEECRDAAKQLGLKDTKVRVETESEWPPGCYLNNGEKTGEKLYFNKNNKSTRECTEDYRVCICKKSSGNTNEKHEDDRTETETSDKYTEKGKPLDKGCCSKVLIDFVEGFQHLGSVQDPYISKLYSASKLYLSAESKPTIFVKEDTKDGRYLYKAETSSNKFAMWWEAGYWMVGQYAQRYKGTALAFAEGFEYCPEDINYTWKYFSHYDKKFYPANEGMSVYPYC